MDIQNIEFGSELKEPNIGGFKAGDVIQISEKIDGSNASFRYDVETNTLKAFSRKRELSYDLTLNGFWNFIQGLNPEEYKDYPNLIFFGEWMTPHTVRYDQDVYRKWYVYDIYNVDTLGYLPQSEVKAFAEKHGFNYIHVLYEGPFISWDHCKGFCHSPAYGEQQEGIVVKNQTKMNDESSRRPSVLKIVNDSFKETKKSNHIRKIEDPQKIQAREQAQEVVDAIVTKERVTKEIFKMRDEGILPEKIVPQDMGLVAKNLPKRIYDDCVKEEKELVVHAGEPFGKLCSSKAMMLAREFLLGA